MAQYKSLKSVAHALARAFVAEGSYADSDFAHCHVLAQTRDGGSTSFTIDLLELPGAFPPALPDAFLAACLRLSQRLSALVASSGSAMTLVAGATLHVVAEVAPDAAVLRGHLTVEARIRDDRGREYADTFVAPVSCIGPRWDAA